MLVTLGEEIVFLSSDNSPSHQKRFHRYGQIWNPLLNSNTFHSPLGSFTFTAKEEIWRKKLNLQPTLTCKPGQRWGGFWWDLWHRRTRWRSARWGSWSRTSECWTSSRRRCRQGKATGRWNRVKQMILFCAFLQHPLTDNFEENIPWFLASGNVTFSLFMINHGWKSAQWPEL